MPLTYRALRTCLQAFPFWQGAIAFACQLVLVIFQIGVVVLALMEVQRKKAGRPPPKRGIGAPVALLGRPRHQHSARAMQRVPCGSRPALAGKAFVLPVGSLGRPEKSLHRPAAAAVLAGAACPQPNSARPVFLAGSARGSMLRGRAAQQARLAALGTRQPVHVL